MRHKLIEGDLDALRPQGHKRTLSREQLARPQAVGFWCDPARARMRARFGEGDAYVAFLREYHETEARSGKPFFPDPDIILEILGPKRPEEPVARYLESAALAVRLGCAVVADGRLRILAPVVRAGVPAKTGE